MSTIITYALIVGIENYNQSKHFPRIKFATKDAEEFGSALIATGVPREDVRILLDSKATKTAIEQEIALILRKVLKNDRIIFYFSGHGAYENKENFLLPADCYNEDINGTSISINEILGLLNKSVCEKNVLFLDACHSGFEPGKDTKDIDKNFMADQLIYNSRDEEYTIGFASCKSNQRSINHPLLKNSVWSHFLIKALEGNAGNIYEGGLLYSDKLQTYLNKTTKEFVKLNTDDKKDQVPIVFGNITDRFIVADLNEVFDERERSKKSEDFSFTNISLLSEEEGSVNKLPGFQKGFHKEPTYLGPVPNSFIQDKGASIIEDEITSLSTKISQKLKYKRAQIRTTAHLGVGSIETPDFDYSIVLAQSATEPKDYVITRKLENFRNSHILTNSDFNVIFSNKFDSLVFSLNTHINIEDLIDKIEALDEDSPIKVNYTPSDLSTCRIEISDLNYYINVSVDSISISTDYQTTPENLVAAYKETYMAISASPELKILE